MTSYNDQLDLGFGKRMLWISTRSHNRREESLVALTEGYLDMAVTMYPAACRSKGLESALELLAFMAVIYAKSNGQWWPPYFRRYWDAIHSIREELERTSKPVVPCDDLILTCLLVSLGRFGAKGQHVENMEHWDVHTRGVSCMVGMRGTSILKIARSMQLYNAAQSHRALLDKRQTQ